MPRYRVIHRTEYRYGERVPAGHSLVHLRPRDTDRQFVHYARLGILPEPATTRLFTDFFGNRAAWFSQQEPHESLAIVATSEVDVAPAVPPARGPAATPWDEVPGILDGRTDPVALDARQFLFASHYVPRRHEPAEYARPSFAPGRPLIEAVMDLTRRIHAEFAFDPSATTVGTPVLEVLKRRRGVCQDFAHLQVSCLRSLGLPARYVSGYLMTRPPPGKPRMVGSDVSHAWVGVYLPDHGWIDFDPTNDVIASDEHITVGWARDYQDLAPVAGVITGGHQHTLKVSVDVEPLTSTGTPADAMSLVAARVPTS
ncbi:MAG: transglutaminase domain-containing protein [Phycisphaerae bacterium]|nr:transglutaminase family protein [Tepidisphaeraceae bacterium]